MRDVIPSWLIPNWTATREDVQWPWTYVLTFFCVTSPISVGWVFSSMSAETGSAGIPASFFTLLYLMVIIGLGLRESTEILYDAVRLVGRFFAAAFIGIVLLLMLDIVNPASPDLMYIVAFSITGAAFWLGVVLFGVWVFQFARKGTSGVNTEPF